MANKGMSGIHSARMGKDEWLTPPWILAPLGKFDLDPCAPINRPWETAARHYTINDNGLELPWEGRVWCNPPYGRQAEAWLDKMARHANGIALIFARTETEIFWKHVWNRAFGLLFIKGRLTFHHVSGELAKGNSGAPSVLIAYGANNMNVLEQCGIPGVCMTLKYPECRIIQNS